MSKRKIVTSGKAMSLEEAEMEKSRDTSTGKALKEADQAYERRKR